MLALEYRIIGTFNVATGKSSSFHEIAEIIIDSIGYNDIKIINTKLEQPITERHYNIEKLKTNFSHFNPINLKDGIRSYCQNTLMRKRNEN